MRYVYVLLAGFLAIGMFGCSDDDNPANSPPVGEATYILTFTATWSAQTHPSDFPGNPHWSSLVGAVHNDSVIFWEVGELASLAVKNVAERGAPGQMINAADAAVDSGTARETI